MSKFSEEIRRMVTFNKETWKGIDDAAGAVRSQWSEAESVGRL